MSRITTLKHGESVDARRIVSRNYSDGDMTAPTSTDPGMHTQHGDYIHVFVKLTGVESANIVPWFWSEIAEDWFPHNTLPMDDTTLLARIEARGHDRVIFTVQDMVSAGGSGTVEVWAGYSYENQPV